MKKIAFVVMEIFLFFLCVQGSSIRIFHDFGSGSADGTYPYGSMILSGSTLYGMTKAGGDSDMGVIFKISTNGTGYTLVHEFAGGYDDGCEPRGSLILSGTTLYGMTLRGGDIHGGTIFKIETNGTGFSLLHDFLGGADDGGYPQGSLILAGTTLYGMTNSGGDNNKGTIFKVETNGTGFTLLHEFAGGDNDGQWPQGSLVISGTTLYGMTRTGSDNVAGTIFKIETNGNNYSLLYKFNINTASYPEGSLILSGSTLYGTTSLGGSAHLGTIFKIETNGNNFTVLHEFLGGTDDGAGPKGSLILSGTMLYGMTEKGGYDDLGTIFKISTTGTGFGLLHKFEGLTDDGSTPQHGSLSISGNVLYGMTISGGQHDQGAIFTHATGLTMGGDFNHDGVTDLLWRRYALGGSNTIWMMSEATVGPALAGEENREQGEREEGSGWEVEGEENTECDIDENNVGAGPDGRSLGSPLQDVYESALPEGEGMSAESPLPEYPGPFGAISVLANVPLVELPDLTWKIVGTGDFNRDGSIDILWRYNGTGGSNAVWLMDYIYKSAAVALPALSTLSWEIMGTGDFNSDKKVDILWRNKTSGSNMVWLMDGLSKTGEVSLPAQTNLTWKIVGCGDFNNNGKTDILWRYQGAGGGNQVWLMNGTTRQSIVNIKAETNLNWKIVGVGDFNKDGKADIIWRSSAAGGANRIWIMNNTAYARTETLPAVTDLTWKIEN